MKFTIDTISKTIEIDGEINLAELNKELKTMFPKDWDKFKICSTQKNYLPYYYPSPYLPFNSPMGTYRGVLTTTNNSDLAV
jgi:hypothetical protein